MQKKWTPLALGRPPFLVETVATSHTLVSLDHPGCCPSASLAKFCFLCPICTVSAQHLQAAQQAFGRLKLCGPDREPRTPLLIMPRDGTWKQRPTRSAQPQTSSHWNENGAHRGEAGHALSWRWGRSLFCPLPEAVVVEKVTSLLDPRATWEDPWDQLSEQKREVKLSWMVSPSHVMDTRGLLLSFLNEDVPDQGWYPRISTVGQTPSSYLNSRRCPGQSLATCAHFYRLLAHFLWSSCLVQSVATVLYLKSPSHGEKSWNILTDTKIMKHNHIYFCTYQSHSSRLHQILHPSENSDIIAGDQGTYFISQNSHSTVWALEQTLTRIFTALASFRRQASQSTLTNRLPKWAHIQVNAASLILVPSPTSGINFRRN